MEKEKRGSSNGEDVEKAALLGGGGSNNGGGGGEGSNKQGGGGGNGGGGGGGGGAQGAGKDGGHPVQPELYGIPYKWVAFGALICLQVLIGVLYKFSQSKDTYAYSTYSAFALAELGKLSISVFMHWQNHSGLPFGEVARALVKDYTWGEVLRIWTLALMYFFNNQLTFQLFLWADPASLNLLKAGSSLITALIWCFLMGQAITARQFGAIATQVLGLVVVQVDACKSTLLLRPTVYAAIGVSVLTTALSGVWNEQQLKTLPLTLHQQNAVLYVGGVVLNASGHFYKRIAEPGFPSFFQGYNRFTLIIIIVNAFFGVVVTAVYKYADAILKTLASACTTVVLLLISFQFFGLQLNLIRVCGCAVVLIAVADYATLPPDRSTVLTWAQRRRLLAWALGGIAAAGLLVYAYRSGGAPAAATAVAAAAPAKKP